jgi:phospholipase/lecithinase/hemolysin
MKIRFILAAAAVALSGASAGASSFSAPYSSFWVIGDSLADNGNAFAFAPEAIPSPPYFEGRVSDGPTFAESLADDFDAEGKPNDILAFAGAQAVTDGDLIPDLAAQAFAPFPIYADGGTGLIGRAAQFGPRPLVSLFIGSNDVLGAFGRGEDPVAAAGAAASEVLGSIAGLSGFGLRDFIVLGLPDFGLIPRLNGLPAPVRDVASAAALTFDATIAAGLGTLPAGVQVTQVDVFSALRDILGPDNPLGLTNTTDACLTFGMDADGNRTITGLCADPSTYAFFDDIHPTGTVHAALADTVRATLAPIPLPAAGWALLAALGVLAGVGRRRRAA